MSEVKRFWCGLQHVLASDYDAAQSELSALREENERLKSESFEELYNAAIDERDALRGEVSKWKGRTTNVCMKLTAAEQRNAELTLLLKRAEPLVRRHEFQRAIDVADEMHAAFKPTESGASE